MANKRKIVPLFVLSAIIALLTPMFASAQSWRRGDGDRDNRSRRERFEQPRRFYGRWEWGRPHAPVYDWPFQERRWRRHHDRDFDRR